jgi:glutathione peroxidase
MSDSLYDIPVARIDGAASSLREHAGKVLLVVNVASACGLTPQYESLEKLYEAEGERGLVVLGFPSNQFGAQEPGSNDEIVEFCSAKYGVRFPMFEKIDVNGEARHPLYRELVAAQPEAREKSADFREQLAKYGVKAERPGDVLWNFEKFLVARDGRVVGRFAPDVTVDDPLLKEAIEAELEPASVR